jgi:exopolyphosphatase/guanosine-5'-triphosphate,3'-diphosphate pyrophosphatase
MTLAAIDIGSNAVRLLIMEAATAKDGEVSYTKQNFLRVPLRLGTDVFGDGFITDEKVSDLGDTLKAFALLMRLHRVSRYRACATSAMRDAGNREEVVARIERESGITVEIISGDEEARLLYDALRAASGDEERPCLFIDVGGGSTEISLFARQQMLFRRSFNIGTIRMIQGTVSRKEMDEVKAFVKSRIAGDVKAVGTGGNIHKLHALARLKRSRPLSLEVLKDFLDSMERLSLDERMARYHLRRDRADVIVPALQLYCSLMRWGGIREIYVPKIGLANGIICSLYLQCGPESMS